MGRELSGTSTSHKPVVQLAFAKQSLKLGPRVASAGVAVVMSGPHQFQRTGELIVIRSVFALGWATWKQNIQKSFFGHFHGPCFHFFPFLGLDHVDGQFRQIPDHGFNVPAHVPDFRKFGGFHFQEGGLSQARQSSGDFRFCPRPWDRS